MVFRVNGFVLGVSYCVSILSLILISFNRYVKVCHRPAFRRLFSARRNLAMCATAWGVAALLNAPPFLPTGSNIKYDNDLHMCMASSTEKGVHYGSVVMIVMLVLPLLLVGYFNAAIFRRWYGSRRRLQRRNRREQTACKATWKSHVSRSLMDLSAKDDESQADTTPSNPSSGSHSDMTSSTMCTTDDDSKEGVQHEPGMMRRSSSSAVVLCHRDPGPHQDTGLRRKVFAHTLDRDRLHDAPRAARKRLAAEPANNDKKDEENVKADPDPEVNRSINYLDRIADAIDVIEKRSTQIGVNNVKAKIQITDQQGKAKSHSINKQGKMKDQCTGQTDRLKPNGPVSPGGRPSSAQVIRTTDDPEVNVTVRKRQAATLRVRSRLTSGLYEVGKRFHKGRKGSTRKVRRPALRTSTLDLNTLSWCDIHVTTADTSSSSDGAHIHGVGGLSSSSFNAGSMSDFETAFAADAERRTDTTERSSDRHPSDCPQRALYPSIERRGAARSNPDNWRRCTTMGRQAISDAALVRSLLVIVVCLVVCYTPFVVVLVHSIVIQNGLHPEVPAAAMLLLFVNCTVNWLLYGIMNTVFRHAYITTLTNFACCCNSNNRARALSLGEF